jgi:hypothetical protein
MPRRVFSAPRTDRVPDVETTAKRPSLTHLLRAWATARNLAAVGIVAELLGAIRTLSERYRLEASSGQPLSRTLLDGLWGGALVFVCFVLVSVLLYVFGRYRLSLLSAILCVVTMVAYKLLVLPEL